MTAHGPPDRGPDEATAAASRAASCWTRREQVLSRRLPDGWLLAAVHGSDDPVHLEDSASDVWDLLATPHTVGDLTRAFVERFTIAESDASTAIESCLAALSRHHLIESGAVGSEGDRREAGPVGDAEAIARTGPGGAAGLRGDTGVGPPVP